MSINVFGTWQPKHEWPKKIVSNFAPSYPTYAQLTGSIEDDFQAIGSSWLIDNPRGILADDMGLGKCKMTLDAVMHVARHSTAFGSDSIRKVIIICEASNIDTWLDELEKWYPRQPKFAFRGNDRLRKYEAFRGEFRLNFPAFTIMSYAVYRLDHDKILLDQFDWAILDEGQVIRGNQLNGIKNQSQIAKTIHDLKPRRRHILSGTPIITTPADWHNIGKWIGAEERSWTTFERETLVVIAIKLSRWVTQRKIVGEVPAGLVTMRAKLERCMLRRTKDEVLKNLPEKRKVNRIVRMTSKEVTAYNQMKEAHKNAVEKLGKGDEPAINPNVALMRMEQLTSSIPSKIEAAMTIVQEATGSGQKVLVFTKHLETLRMLYSALKKEKIEFVTIHGGVSTDAKENEQSERGKAVHAFQENDNVKVLIGTSQACRVGLTLTAASVVILMDEEYSPKYVQQLIDRAHRIGQKNSVLVIRLEAVRPFGLKFKHTIERQLQLMLKRRNTVTDSVVTLSQFSSKEILEALEDDDGTTEESAET